LSRRTLWMLLLYAACIGLAAYFVLIKADWTALLELDLGTFFSIIALTAFYVVVHTRLAQTLLQSSGHRPGLSRVYLVLTASMSANYAAPVKIGMPVQVWLYKQVLSIPVPIGLAVVAVEFFLSLVLPLIFSIAGSLVIFPEQSAKPLLFGGGLVLLVAMSFVLWKPQWFLGLLDCPRLKKPISHLSRHVQEFQTGIRRLSVGTILQVVALLLLMYLVSAWRLTLILKAFGWQASITDLVLAQLTSFTLGSLSMLPMGLGVRDISLAFLLTRLGIPLQVATLAAVIERSVTTGTTALLGIISINVLGMMGFNIRKKPSRRLDDSET